MVSAVTWWVGKEGMMIERRNYLNEIFLEFREKRKGPGAREKGEGLINKTDPQSDEEWSLPKSIGTSSKGL